MNLEKLILDLQKTSEKLRVNGVNIHNLNNCLFVDEHQEEYESYSELEQCVKIGLIQELFVMLNSLDNEVSRQSKSIETLKNRIQGGENKNPEYTAQLNVRKNVNI